MPGISDMWRHIGPTKKNIIVGVVFMVVASTPSTPKGNPEPAPGRVLELAGECAAGGAVSEVGDVVDDGGGRRGCPRRI